MKTVLLFVAATFFANFAQAQSEERMLLSCFSQLPGAAGYTLSAPLEGEHAHTYKLTKHFNNPMVKPLSLTLDYSDVIFYGDAVIVTSNLGRSGYVHLYHSKQTTVIDINRFPQTAMNTNGPLTGYTCHSLR